MPTGQRLTAVRIYTEGVRDTPRPPSEVQSLCVYEPLASGEG